MCVCVCMCVCVSVCVCVYILVWPRVTQSLPAAAWNGVQARAKCVSAALSTLRLDMLRSTCSWRSQLAGVDRS